MSSTSESSHSAGNHGEEGEEESEFPEWIAFGVVPLAMALGILTRTTLAKVLPIPYTVLLLIWGGVFGVLHTELGDPFNPALNNAIQAWITMDPRMLQIVFFPILIFASAFNAQFHILERRLGQILFLALPGVILGAGLTATFMKYVLPYDWDWNLCMVFGSMVAATDPVAVVALLEELGVSEKLGTLIEGESLLNDGSAIVVFEVFLEAVEGHSRNWHEVIEFGCRLALGGPAIGAVVGIMGAFVLGYVINDALVEVSLTLLLAFSTFALCEATSIKVSGVLGIVACGVVLSYYGKPRVSSPVLPSLMDFWKTLQFFADTTIFFLSGVVTLSRLLVLLVFFFAIDEDRAIAGADFGYLLCLFVALYVIRGFVILTAYPVLRTGEYKISVPQMMVLTHSGLRGAVALILALVVDGGDEHIDQVDKDAIVFLTAGVAVLSLVVNGTTTGPLVRFLKLDRASEASQSVFGQACFALELSMQKQEQLLKEDPFLCDANWNLVWRYLPLFTAESYFTRLSKGHIALSANEASPLEDIRDANSRARKRGKEHRSIFEIVMAWFRNKKGGLSYASIPHRLRFPWYDYHTKFLFADAGGEKVWGDLESFLANHTAGDDSVEAWTGHLKFSKPDGGISGTIDKFSKEHAQTSHGHRSPKPSSHGGRGESKANDGEPSTVMRGGAACGPETCVDATTATVAAKATKDMTGTAPTSSALESSPDSPSSDKISSFVGEDHDMRDDKNRKKSLSKRMFQRVATVAQNAGISINLTNEDHEGHDHDLNDQGIDKSELLEARFRFLQCLKAEYFKAKREGKLGSSGLRVLVESINNAHDKVDKGGELNGWSELSGNFSSGWQMFFAKYMNWWPARPVMAGAIARRVSFQIDLAWNFLEAHHESNLKSLLADEGKISDVQCQVNLENQKQIDEVEETINKLTIDAPMVMRSVKTRTAARIMVERFREATEMLAENGHLDEKEEEVLQHAVTNTEMMIAYHPNLEELPELSVVLEKIEFLHELTPEQRQRLIDAGACFYHEYVGEVRLMEMGKLGARGTKRSVEKDFRFRGWFYVVRGQVEKEYKTDNGCEYVTHSSGLLFGITDAMLGCPHHAGYVTHGFSNLVVFDRHRLFQEAEQMPELDCSLWKSVAAHCLRRNTRFHRFKLQSCHSLIDRAEFLSGKSGMCGEEIIEIAADDAIVLVRGKIISKKGELAVGSLGRADKNSAPVLIEPVGGGDDRNIKVSGDYKAFRLPSDMLANFAHEERGRMMMQETMKRESMTFSTAHHNNRQQEDFAGAAADAQQKSLAMSQALEQEMEAKFNLKNPVAARVGAQAAMKFMTGLKRSKEEQEEKKDNEGGHAGAAAAAAAAAVRARDGNGGGGNAGAGGGTGDDDIYGQ
ncbi:unnamed protein product [Scytosiphon promiscuus]